MKKEIIAVISLILLFIGAACNILQIRKISNSMSDHIQNAAHACNTNQFDVGEQLLNNALTLWLNNDNYTHIFIRHSEVDATTDAIYDAISAVRDKSQSSIYEISKIQYHIDSIYAMEKITFKSVF